MKDKIRQDMKEPASAQEALVPELHGLRKARIAALAYSYAQERGFSGNHELDDWLRAERDIDSAEEALTAE